MMKKYVNFTQSFVQNALTDKKRERFYDTGFDGLVLSVTFSGNKSYYLKFWRANASGQGVSVERVIGQTKNLSVRQARELARALKSEFTVGDPRALYRSRDITLEDVHQVWLKDIEHEVRVGNASEKYVFNKRRCWEIHMPIELARKRMDEVDVAEFTEFFQDIREQSESVHNKLVKHVKGLFRIARERMNFDVPNPFTRYKVAKDDVRERFLTIDEMSVLFDALSKEKQIYQDLVMSLLLTGQRKNAVLSMRWVDLDLMGRNWRIPKEMMKGRVGGHVVPIAKALVDVLERRKNEHDGSVFVFPAQRGKGGHVTVGGGHTTWWGKVKSRSGLTDIRLHDLRRTLGSWLAIDGVDIYKISKVLAHKDVRVTQEVYAHLKALDARDDIDRVADRMVGQPDRKIEGLDTVNGMELLAESMSGEDRMKMISVLSRSVS